MFSLANKRLWIALAIAISTLSFASVIFGTNLPSSFRKRFFEKPSALELTGQVTYLDIGDNFFFLQNSTGGYRVDATRLPNSLTVGDQVDVFAMVEPPAGSHCLQAVSIELGEKAPKLLPVSVDPSALQSNQLEQGGKSKQLVEVTGIVRDAHVTSTSFHLRLRIQQTDVKVKLFSYGNLQPEMVLGSTLRVRGVLDGELAADGLTLRPVLLVQEAKAPNFVVLQPATLLKDLSLTSVADLPKLDTTAQEHPIRLRGLITSSASGQGQLTDNTGSILISSRDNAAPNTPLDAWGYLGYRHGIPELEDAVLVDRGENERRLHQDSLPRKLLTTVQLVHNLPPPIAKLRYPVSLQGVITYISSNQSEFFLQDSTGGIYCTPAAIGSIPLQVGQKVSLTGRTGAGGFAPVVTDAVVHVVGSAKLPKPADVSLTEILSGRQDGKWIEAEGVVHRLSHEESEGYAVVEIGGNEVGLLLPRPEDLSPSLVDARVRVRGVCATVFDSRRQLRGVKMFVPGRNFIQVLTPSIAPDHLPISRISDLEQFSTVAEPGHRRRIQAVITKIGRKGRIFLRDSTGAVRANFAVSSGLDPGDLVNVVGFVRREPTGLVIRDATATLLKRNVPIPPVLVSPEEVLEDDLEAQLVELHATLLDSAFTRGMQTLILQAGRTIFRATLEQGRIATAPRGSLLRVQGVTELSPAVSNLDIAFTLLLRSPQDVTVLQTAPWWKSEQLGWVLLAIGTLTSLIMGWALLLRRQIRRQTGIIRGQLHEAEILREAAEAASQAKGDFLANMSHEIRTPLNGVLGLTEIALMQPLEPMVREYIEMARDSGLGLLQVINDVLDFSQIEAGKMTINLAPLDLCTLLQDALQQFRVAAEQKAIGLHLHFPAETARHFIGDAARIRQVVLNVIGNAVKFTGQGEINVHVQSSFLDENRRTLRITVQDTGIGIPIDQQVELFSSFHQVDTSTTRKYGGIGLGLSIARRLLELMGGTIACSSQVGVGSVFTVELPMLLDTAPSSSAEQPVDGAGGLQPLQQALYSASETLRDVA